MKLRLLAAGAALMLTLSACGGSDSGSSTPNAAPTDKTLHLSFLQDPAQPPDPDIYYSGQGLVITQNVYEGLLQYKTGVDTPQIAPALATAVPRRTTAGGISSTSAAILISNASIFLPRYSGVRPTMRPAMKTATMANISMP